MSHLLRRTLTVAALLLGAGCADAPVLQLKLVTPEGPDPLLAAERLRLAVSQPASEKVIGLDNKDSFTLELKVEVQGAVGTITLEGLAGQSLVARGETPPMILRPTGREMSLLIGRAGALSTLRPRLEAPGQEMTSILVPSLGVLLAGGRGADDRPLASASLYDFFGHTVQRLQPLPAPRDGALGVPWSSGALVLLGADDKALATQTLRFDGTTWTAIADGLPAPERRRDAAIAVLDDGRYLIVGGKGPAGTAQDSVLRLDPGDLTRDPAYDVLAVRSKAARLRPAVATGTGVVLFAGGQPAGGPAVEVFYTASSSFQTVTLPGPALAGGCAVTDLGDGRVAVIGGRDEAGVRLRDAWIVDPTTLTAIAVPGALAEGRADHFAVRLGAQVVVVGGATDKGPAAQAEVLEVKALSAIGVTAVPSPRGGTVVGRIGQGSFILAGGTGAAAGELAVYETAQGAK